MRSKSIQSASFLWIILMTFEKSWTNFTVRVWVVWPTLIFKNVATKRVHESNQSHHDWPSHRSTRFLFTGFLDRNVHTNVQTKAVVARFEKTATETVSVNPQPLNEPIRHRNKKCLYRWQKFWNGIESRNLFVSFFTWCSFLPSLFTARKAFCLQRLWKMSTM